MCVTYFISLGRNTELDGVELRAVRTLSFLLASLSKAQQLWCSLSCRLTKNQRLSSSHGIQMTFISLSSSAK